MDDCGRNLNILVHTHTNTCARMYTLKDIFVLSYEKSEWKKMSDYKN